MSLSMNNRTKNLLWESDVKEECDKSDELMMVMCFVWKEELKRKERKEKRKKKKKDYKLHLTVLAILWITLMSSIELSDQNFF